MTTRQEEPAAPAAPAAGTERRRVTVCGVVQGVGFRPFTHALARELGLSGHVANTGQGVISEVEGMRDAVAQFCSRIRSDAPPAALVESVADEVLPLAGGSTFTIEPSRGGPARTLVPPDLATCADCLSELTDPSDRRYRHPFISCTHCGPRFTIVRSLPYDRAGTTMCDFPLCARCEAEYTDPADRRFHAQPVACHDCGPSLRLLVRDADGQAAPVVGDPVEGARRLLARGATVAVKGLGGYHLACDAADEKAVRTLRRRKGRAAKPFALMARDEEEADLIAHVDDTERELLRGSRRPVVLLRRRARVRAGVPGPAPSVAPGSADLGVMLPYTPVHRLLFGLPGDPEGPRLLVMTSGNTGGEPIVTDDEEAVRRLAPLADAWLTHDRPIHVPCDDSVVRVLGGQEHLLRRSRGYAPFPVPVPVPVTPALAVGGDLKNAFCLGEGGRAWLSAHVGNMDDLATLTAFGSAERRLEDVTGVRPRLFVTDRHPGYRSGRWAREHAEGRPVRQVQHHHAHVASVMAEHGLDGTRPVLGVAFDGTGYGDDGAVWGGEFLVADYDGFTRAGRLAYVPLPGGDAAVHRPYRTAVAHLRAAGLSPDPDLPCVQACETGELPLLEKQLERNLNCLPTSSMGRLFDAVSALTGVCVRSDYEARAALELEAAAVGAADADDGAYTFAVRVEESGGPLIADPAPVLRQIVDDLRRGCTAGVVAARFHRAVAALVCTVCVAVRERHGADTVGLSGGVFANSLLSRDCTRGLRAEGFTVLRHRLVPAGDGGLALGQLVIGARAVAEPPAGTQAEPAPADGRSE